MIPLVAISAYCLVVAALSAALTFVIMRRQPLMDVPNARSSHRAPTPRGGGMAIVAASAAGIAALGMDGHPGVIRDLPLIGVMAGALIVAASGLADDIKPLSYAAKLAAQAAAALVAMSCGVTIETVYLPGIGPTALGALAWPLTLLWLVGLTNAYNFMDGVDGLAGGTALIAGAFLTAIMIGVGAIDAGAVAATLAAGAAGFLIFNRPPARIFMGDVGSQFLGFGFAALGVILARQSGDGVLIYAVPLLLFHFLFDTLVTAIRRWRRGENVTQAHRTHLYQRLTHSDFGHGRTTLLLCAMGAAQGCATLWLMRAAPNVALWAFAPILVIQLGYIRIVAIRERRAAAKS